MMEKYPESILYRGTGDGYSPSSIWTLMQSDLTAKNTLGYKYRKRDRNLLWGKPCEGGECHIKLSFLSTARTGDTTVPMNPSRPMVG
ncbi:hypothetical protein EYC80_009070 [Monilinia laxa]|uniref:Uncharacterized protein n=1 Tax=Monilinia laxa TaxID=61186 RepID=A0A5N6K2T3_MONLA|nr:hypothetical protein EYC80_009070 [Monilinia laxa]